MPILTPAGQGQSAQTVKRWKLQVSNACQVDFLSCLLFVACLLVEQGQYLSQFAKLYNSIVD